MSLVAPEVVAPVVAEVAPEVLDEVEREVNRRIFENAGVGTTVEDLEAAKERGVVALGGGAVLDEAKNRMEIRGLPYSQLGKMKSMVARERQLMVGDEMLPPIP